jgi:hypothetical protein
MSFKRFTPSDFLVSADSVTAPCWTNNVYDLTSFFTSSTQAASSQGNYVLAVYQTASTDSTAAIQFYLGYANQLGSGSVAYNSQIPEYSPSSTLYGQWRNLILEDENAQFLFGAVTQSDFFIIAVERANYKQSLFPGSLNLLLSGSGTTKITLTDNSNDISVVPYINGTRVYQIVSGSNGSAVSTTTGGSTVAGQTVSGSYGWFVPDMGAILLNAQALALTANSGGIALSYSGSFGNQTNVANGYNNTRIFTAISGGKSFELNSQENVTSDFVFVRPQNAEFNYTTNPSFITGSTGEVLYSTSINNPQVYITTVGMYNDSNELLAVAKLSRPLVKDFTKEALIRVKLDF